VPADRLARLVARLQSYHQEAVRGSGYAFVPGAVELVREASAAGLMLGVVSDSGADEVEEALRQAGARALFKAVVSGDDAAAAAEGERRPDGYQAAMGQLNSLPPLPERLLHPHEVLAIEARPEGLAAARAAGLVTLGVARGRPALELEADVVVAALGELGLGRLQELYAEASRA
jgi:sugar-phosphatase